MSGVFQDAYEQIFETLQNAAGATGVGTPIDVKGMRSFTLHVTGTFVGTVSFEATIDDTNWFAVSLRNVGTVANASSATAAGAFAPGSELMGMVLSQVRANVTAWTSGAITVKSRKHPR